MEISDAFLLALGVFCEFLPVSSSAHFWLVQWLSGVHASHHALMLTHLVPLAVLVVYFFPVWIEGVNDMFASVKKRSLVGRAYILFCLAVSVCPLVVIGAWKYYARWGVEDILGVNEGRIIGASFVLFGAALLLADRCAPENKSWKSFDAKDALIMGILQCLSLLNGASRLGLAIMGARCLGYRRQDSLTLGLLTGVPVLFGAQVLYAQDVWAYYESLSVQQWLWPFVFALVGLGSAFLLMAKRGYTIVAVYRIVVGFLVLMLL